MGPISTGANVTKKDEVGDLARALSLLQKIVTPEDFVKYQVMVAPKPKQNKKTREQELADKVKSLEKLRSQEASHKGQIDKLEHDLQRHRYMLQWMMRSKISGHKLRERSLIVMERMLQLWAAPPMRGAVGQVFDPTAPAALNLGPFESCVEDMLFDASEGEDEREASRCNGIWERRRSGVIKRVSWLKTKKELRRSKVNPSLLRK